MCQALPGKYDGQRIATDIDRVTKILPDGFEIVEEDFTIKIVGANVVPKVGDYVRVIGKFNKGNFIEVEKIKIYEGYLTKRMLKYVISIIVIVVGAFYFFKAFKIDLHKGIFH